MRATLLLAAIAALSNALPVARDAAVSSERHATSENAAVSLERRAVSENLVVSPKRSIAADKAAVSLRRRAEAAAGDIKWGTGYGEKLDDTTPVELSCPPGEFISEISGRAGTQMDCLSIKCSDKKTITMQSMYVGNCKNGGDPFFLEYTEGIGAIYAEMDIGGWLSVLSYGGYHVGFKDGDKAVVKGLELAKTSNVTGKTLETPCPGKPIVAIRAWAKSLIGKLQLGSRCDMNYTETLKKPAATTQNFRELSSRTPYAETALTWAKEEKEPAGEKFTFVCNDGSHITHIVGVLSTGKPMHIKALQFKCGTKEKTTLASDFSHQKAELAKDGIARSLAYSDAGYTALDLISGKEGLQAIKCVRNGKSWTLGDYDATDKGLPVPHPCGKDATKPFAAVRVWGTGETVSHISFGAVCTA